MYAVTLPHDADEAQFRDAARRCLAAGLAPSQIVFADPHEASLLPPLTPDEPAPAPVSVPRAYAELMHDAICHRASDRFALLYEVLWRIVQGERELVSRAADPAVARLNDYAHNVRRDIHKMHAFLRFRARKVGDATVYTAWFEPQHYTLTRAVPFFIDRFTSMDWLITTPIGTAAWHDGTLRYGPPGPRPPADDDSVLDELWLRYYRTTFNPARLRVKAMTAEMPRHYWRNMPETALIPDLVAGASARVAAMDECPADTPPRFSQRIAERGRQPIPASPEPSPAPLAQLRVEAAQCRRCPLHAAATQTVFGAGPEHARLVFVGEQPGDQEDIAGQPFVGPAGALFDRALAEAGIARENVYVTNAVKHFKYEPRGKRRIHKKPNAGEVAHCRFWLERELATIAPALVVALGATAAQSLAGHPVSVLRDRGPADFAGHAGFITVHPAFLLRLPDANRQAEEYARFVADLRQVCALTGATPAAQPM